METQRAPNDGRGPSLSQTAQTVAPLHTTMQESPRCEEAAQNAGAASEERPVQALW